MILQQHKYIASVVLSYDTKSMQLFLEKAKACYGKYDPEGSGEVSAWEVKVRIVLIWRNIGLSCSSRGPYWLARLY